MKETSPDKNCSVRPLLVIDGLHVSLNGSRILTDIQAEIRAGEFLGIIGPNGSGKTTLIRAMSGVILPSRGSILLANREVSSMPPHERARMLAVVAQNSDIAFGYTVLEIVLMGRSPYLGRFRFEGARDVELAISALERTGLAELAHRSIADLSGGERQRVMIARALCQQTDILLLDEPTAHLDINYQVEVLHLLKKESAQSGKTVVVVLHDLNLASEFCDRLLILHRGCLHADGPPEHVVTSDTVREVYGTAVWVKTHPTSGKPYVLSVGSPAVAAKLMADAHGGARLRVHVICGGGSAGRVFAALLECGCEVTAGVINIGDTDQEAAESMGLEYVEEAPFSAVSNAARSANAEFIARADAVVVAEAPFGEGNLANLEEALTAARSRKPVAVLGSRDSFSSRDFTRGKAQRLLEEILQAGADNVESTAALKAWIAKLCLA